jgi:hypothetical protein
VRIARFLHAAEDEYQGHGGKQRVHPEDPLPTRQRNDHPADDRSKTKPDAENDAPRAERAGALRSFVELVRKDRHLAYQHHAAARTLQQTRDDQRRYALRESANQRRDAEQRNPDHKYPSAAVSVRKGARRHQHGRYCERVGVHDPLHAFEVAVQKPFECGQDHRHAGDFEAEHQ